MYEEIEFDGRKIKIKTSISKEETGVMLEKDDLEDTMDFSKELEVLRDATNAD